MIDVDGAIFVPHPVATTASAARRIIIRLIWVSIINLRNFFLPR